MSQRYLFDFEKESFCRCLRAGAGPCCSLRALGPEQKPEDGSLLPEPSPFPPLILPES